jgi:hypothetical protein
VGARARPNEAATVPPALLKRLLLIVVAFVAFAGVLAACGGDDGPSKDEIVEDANQICEDANEELEPLEADVDPSDLNSLADFAARAQEIIEDGVQDLEELDPPEDDREAFDDFIQVSEDQVDKAGELEDAARAGDSARVQEIADELDELNDRANDAAREYGLDECVDEDDEEGSTDDGTQPQSEVVTEANQACSEFQSEVEGLDQPTSPSEAGTYADEVSSQLDQLINELNALNPDAGQSDYQQVITTFEQQRDKLGELADAARDSDQQRIEEIDSEIDELTQDGAEAAERFGIDECGSSGP